MWSHYADAYKGYCVEFCIENPCKIFPVIYGNNIPDMSKTYQWFYDNRMNFSFSELTDFDKLKNIFSLQYPLISKDVCWSYESEFRIMESSDASKENGSVHYLPKYGLYISKIIVGANCTPYHVERLKEASQRINSNRKKKLIKDTFSLLLNEMGSVPDEPEVRAHSKIISRGIPRYAQVKMARIDWDKKLQLIETSLND